MESVDLRMTKRGVVLFIEGYKDLAQLFADITNKFSQLEGFFAPGDKISVMMKDREKYSKDITEIVSFVEGKGFKVSEILVGELNKKSPNKMSVKHKMDVIESENVKRLNPTKVVKKTVRSGQAVIHDGDIILIGNLNSGGEIVSAGNVIVLGEVKGVVRAGVKGENSSIIYAIHMNPELVQIANKIAHLPDGMENTIAHIRNGKIVFEPYDELKFKETIDREH